MDRNKYPSWGGKGKPLSLEARKKISDALRGKKHWWKNSNGRPPGFKTPEDTKLKISLAMKGRTFSEECLIKKRAYRGSASSNWKGGITKIGLTIRKLPNYCSWRLAIYKRDGYRCKICTVGKPTEIDHIKPFSVILKEFLDINKDKHPSKDLESLALLAIEYNDFWDIQNGQVLCRSCNRKRIGKIWVNQN